MEGRFVKGLIAGSLIGAAAGMMLFPNMNSRSRRNMRQTSKSMMNKAMDMVSNARETR